MLILEKKCEDIFVNVFLFLPYCVIPENIHTPPTDGSSN